MVGNKAIAGRKGDSLEAEIIGNIRAENTDIYRHLPTFSGQRSESPNGRNYQHLLTFTGNVRFFRA